MFSKNLFLIYLLSFSIIFLFLNNTDYQITLKILLILVGFLFFYYIFKKKYFYYLFAIILWSLIGIFISNISFYEIEIKTNILNPYINKWYYESEFQILELEKIWKTNFEYKWKLLNINNNKIEKNIYGTYILKDKQKIWNIISSKLKYYKYENNDNFNYKNYQITKNIYFKAYVYEYKLKWNNLNKYLTKIYDFRELLIKNIYKMYPEDEAAFLGWILIGSRENISPKLKENFNNSWLTHLVAVSWFNITILIIFFWYLVKYLPNYLKFIVISLFIFIFLIIVGYSAPVLRAAIMWIIWYFVLLSWRNNNFLASILITAFIMLLFSPTMINYDISFHLSFLAVIWIVYFSDFFNKIYFFITSKFIIKETFVLTSAALILNLWIIIFNFWQISTTVILANLLVVWTIPIIMLFSFISLIVYFVHPMSGIVISYIPWILLHYDITIINIFWELKSAILYFDFWVYKNYLQVLYLVIMLFIILYFNTWKKK